MASCSSGIWDETNDHRPEKRFELFWGDTQEILHSLGRPSFRSICVLITNLPSNTMELPNFVRMICFQVLSETVDMQIQRITEFPSSWWPATISEKTKWENCSETIYNPQCYSSSHGMIYCTFTSTTHSIFSSLSARISTGLVALTATSGVSKHSYLRSLCSQLFPLFCISFLFFLIHWWEEANMARMTILFLV